MNKKVLLIGSGALLLILSFGIYFFTEEGTNVISDSFSTQSFQPKNDTRVSSPTPTSPICGDGIVEIPEECDNGSSNGKEAVLTSNGWLYCDADCKRVGKRDCQSGGKECTSDNQCIGGSNSGCQGEISPEGSRSCVGPEPCPQLDAKTCQSFVGCSRKLSEPKIIPGKCGCAIIIVPPLDPQNTNICGNGVLEPANGEECDKGNDNGDSNQNNLTTIHLWGNYDYCTENCKIIKQFSCKGGGLSCTASDGCGDEAYCNLGNGSCSGPEPCPQLSSYASCSSIGSCARQTPTQGLCFCK